MRGRDSGITMHVFLTWWDHLASPRSCISCQASIGVGYNKAPWPPPERQSSLALSGVDNYPTQNIIGNYEEHLHRRPNLLRGYLGVRIPTRLQRYNRMPQGNHDWGMRMGEPVPRPPSTNLSYLHGLRYSLVWCHLKPTMHARCMHRCWGKDFGEWSKILYRITTPTNLLKICAAFTTKPFLTRSVTYNSTARIGIKIG